MREFWYAGRSMAAGSAAVGEELFSRLTSPYLSKASGVAWMTLQRSGM
ncbi:hypothetical protein M2105_004958 [Paenibacillus sp. PastF-1]|nr:hypothetical protein [Paenibacillus sp. PastF-1]MDF9857081.1 hypothetical protein [Paenibacillus sp. PastF-1]